MGRLALPVRQIKKANLPFPFALSHLPHSEGPEEGRMDGGTHGAVASAAVEVVWGRSVCWVRDVCVDPVLTLMASLPLPPATEVINAR